MRDMHWHRFIASTDDDNECTNCGVIVADDALNHLTAPCPVPNCQAEDNDGRCVVVRGVKGPECAYCERRFGSEDDEDDLDLDGLDVDADALLAQADQLLAGVPLDELIL